MLLLSEEIHELFDSRTLALLRSVLMSRKISIQNIFFMDEGNLKRFLTFQSLNFLMTMGKSGKRGFTIIYFISPILLFYCNAIQSVTHSLQPVRCKNTASVPLHQARETLLDAGKILLCHHQNKGRRQSEIT